MARLTDRDPNPYADCLREDDRAARECESPAHNPLATEQNRELRTGMKEEKRSMFQRGFYLERETAERKLRCD